MKELEYRREVYKLFKKLEITINYYIENEFLDNYFDLIYKTLLDYEYELLYMLFWDFQKYVEMFLPKNEEIYAIYEEIFDILLVEEDNYE